MRFMRPPFSWVFQRTSEAACGCRNLTQAWPVALVIDASATGTGSSGLICFTIRSVSRSLGGAIDAERLGVQACLVQARLDRRAVDQALLEQRLDVFLRAQVNGGPRVRLRTVGSPTIAG
jgi:hypothetical protein